MKILGRIVLLASCLLCVLFLGCQKSPEKVAVTNKNANALEKTIIEKQDSAPANKKFQCSDRWEQIIEAGEGAIVLDVNANIHIPNVEQYPVMRVKPKNISQEEADKFIAAFAGDLKLYDARPMGSTTKDEQIQLIAEYQNERDLLKETDFDRYERSGGDEDTKKVISEMKNQMDDLPSTYHLVPNSGEFTQTTDEFLGQECEVISVNAYEPGNIVPLNLDIMKNKSNKINHYSYLRNNLTSEIPSVKYYEDLSDAIGLDISLEEARKIAESKMKEIGIEGMDFAGATLNPVIGRTYDPTPLDLQPRVFSLYYTRSVNGIPITYTNAKINTNYDEDDYREPWPEEQVIVVVRNDGIYLFQYYSPMQIEGEFAAHAPLLEFEEIQKLFLRQMAIKYSNIVGMNQIEKYEFSISDIRLGYARVARYNNNDEYLLVPAWDFFGSAKIYFNESAEDANFDENNAMLDDYFAESYLTINAIDGSIIDRTKGY